MVRHNGGSSPAPATTVTALAPDVTAKPSSTSVVLTFTPTNELGYHIHTNFGDEYIVALKDLQANTYTIKNLLPNTSYTYLIGSTTETVPPLHYMSPMKVLTFKTAASGGRRSIKRTRKKKTLRSRISK